jgi:hypothetical protein
MVGQRFPMEISHDHSEWQDENEQIVEVVVWIPTKYVYEGSKRDDTTIETESVMKLQEWFGVDVHFQPIYLLFELLLNFILLLLEHFPLVRGLSDHDFSIFGT